MPDAATVRLKQVRERIHAAAKAAGRNPDTIVLIGVAKTRSAEEVRAMAGAGLIHCGENYLQEALQKQAALTDLPLIWHFIGALQGNKTRTVAERFDWVHTVDRLKLLQRLSAQRPAGLAPLQVCLQVNLDQEASKAGLAPSAVAELAQAAIELPGLELRGLMALPKPSNDMDAQRASLRRLRVLADTLRPQLPDGCCSVLSMGMSNDLEAAIAEGATHVRVGTALFGPRPAAGTAAQGEHA